MKHPISKAYWWLKYRVFNRYHVVEISSLRPGYYDIDARMFHACFDLLVEYVEVELAWMSFIGAEIKLPWWQSKTAYLKAHNKELIERHLSWILTDKEVGERQRNSAIEILALYNWYKHDRPKRLTTRDLWIYNKDLHSKYVKLADLNDEYDKEDVDMFVRLAKIYQHLWT
jgi:hypothetical protein